MRADIITQAENCRIWAGTADPGSVIGQYPRRADWSRSWDCWEAADSWALGWVVSWFPRSSTLLLHVCTPPRSVWVINCRSVCCRCRELTTSCAQLQHFLYYCTTDICYVDLRFCTYQIWNVCFREWMICVLLEWTFTARNLMIGLHYQNPLNMKQNFSRQKLVLQSINNFICLQERIIWQLCNFVGPNNFQFQRINFISEN